MEDTEEASQRMCMPFFSRWFYRRAAKRSVNSKSQLNRGSLSALGLHSHDQSILEESEETPMPIAYIRDEEITIRILEVTSTFDTVAVAASGCLFEKAHVSNSRHEQNKAQMLAEGAIPALGALLGLSRVEIARYHACSALSELAFEHPTNCLAIVNTPGMLKNLVVLLQPNSGGTQEDAARIINNCAAFCEDCIPAIVGYPGMLRALTLMALRGDKDAKHISVGALNSLSRSGLGRAKILKSDALQALATVLDGNTVTSDDRHQATQASAAMAIASLTGDTQPLHAHSVCSFRGRYRSTIRHVVHLLDLSIHRIQWAGILFRPYSILYPLHQLSCNPANRQSLVEFGILDRLRDFLELWHTWSHPRRALELALRILQNIAAGTAECRLRLKDAGLFDGLRIIATVGAETSAGVDGSQLPAARGGDAHMMGANTSTAAVSDPTAAAAAMPCGSGGGGAGGVVAAPASCRRRAAALVEDLAQGCVTFMMGLHPRLGAASPLMMLDEATAALIVEMSMCRDSSPRTAAQPAAAAGSVRS